MIVGASIHFEVEIISVSTSTVLKNMVVEAVPIKALNACTDGAPIIKTTDELMLCL